MKKVKGFTLLEVILALVLLSMLATTFLPIMGWLISRSTRSQYDAQAGEVLQEGMEVAYNVLISGWDKDWSRWPMGVYHPAVDTSFEPNVWTLVPGSQSEVEARFAREIKISPVCREVNTGRRGGEPPCPESWQEDANSKLVKTTVKWQEEGRPKSLTAELLVTYLGD
jgi:prepilin-type N-terminal cleavage/methylation domain-containing protein